MIIILKYLTLESAFSVFQIDSIKCYKDGREFFRLHPNMPINNDNHRKQFQTTGVKINYNTTSVWKTLAHEIVFEKKTIFFFSIKPCRRAGNTPFHW